MRAEESARLARQFADATAHYRVLASPRPSTGFDRAR